MVTDPEPRPDAWRLTGLPDLYTLKEVAKTLHCSPSWLKGQIAEGKLVAAKVAGTYLVTAEDLRSFFDSCKNRPPSKAPSVDVMPSSLEDRQAMKEAAQKVLKERRTAALVLAREKRGPAGSV
ncbi:MAG TPA: helix-turn-helix domain-containing protein [Acetobacteraceae bacterium]|nr:helix-turn-helix domain-containing protein [Acetobacteraceae bacterium]